MTDLIEQVARLTCEASTGEVDEVWPDGPAWTYYKPNAQQVIAIIVERCAPVLREMEATFADPDRLKNSESAMYSFASATTTLRTLAGGENNGGA